jgi:trans-2-enoyl-CoA reductase
VAFGSTRATNFERDDVDYDAEVDPDMKFDVIEL